MMAQNITELLPLTKTPADLEGGATITDNHTGNLEIEHADEERIQELLWNR